MRIRLKSFGWLHLNGGLPPQADRIEDVRGRLRDPAAAKDILDLNGFDPVVQKIVENTPGAQGTLDNLVDYVERCEPRIIAIGCAGGRHRAPSLIEALARRLRDRGHQVEVEHLHVHLPRVLRA